MATYEAEFLSHYYAGRLRPLAAYAFGMIDKWSRLGSSAPWLANFLTQTPWLAAIARRIVGIAPQRRIPRIAAQSFGAWFAARTPPPRKADDMDVILWPDTFNNYFHPQVAQAAVEVLEHAGCHVRLPTRPLCCGRPLYEFGMLDRARKYLREVLDVLDADIRAGTPIIGLEPACVSVFREEMPQLLPDDEQALRLKKQVFLLSEFLQQQRADVNFPKLARKALVHAHCHHKSVLKFDDEKALLTRLGLDVDMPESGCCGMAGSFGFEKDKYEVSVRCGERVLLPAVRDLPSDDLVITDGYSCREQIAQSGGREALHIAEVLQLSVRQAGTRAPR
jgi:Fe-S oxidoreductase